MLRILPNVKACLEGDQFFQALPLAHEEERDIADQIRAKLGALGLFVLIRFGGAAVSGTDCPGPILDPVTVFVEVTENPLLSRPKNNPTALAIALRVMHRLHWANNDKNDPLVNACALAAIRIRAPIIAGGTLTYVTEFQTLETIDPQQD
jgi:hypothetical protein